MHISIHAPTGFSEKGNRENNEDFRYPKPENLDPNQQVFVVCDGVGGAKKGEVASQMVATAFGDYLARAKKTVFEESDFTGAVAVAQTNLETYLEKHPTSSGMGTTLVSLCLHRDGASVVWVGDSRLYQVRKGRIVFKTTDHTLVNEWLRQGIISPEAAATHPQRKVITRALQGRMVSDTQPEVKLLQDVLPGDVFFLCTDGVHEEVSDDELALILSLPETDDEKIARLRRIIEKNPNDNFTATVITVREVMHTGSTKDYSGRPSLQPLPSTAAAGWQPVASPSRPILVEEEPPFFNLKNMGIMAASLIVLIFLMFTFFGNDKPEQIASPEKKELPKPPVPAQNHESSPPAKEPETHQHYEPKNSGGTTKRDLPSSQQQDLTKEIDKVLPKPTTPVGTAEELLKKKGQDEKSETNRNLKDIFKKKDAKTPETSTEQNKKEATPMGPEPLPKPSPDQKPAGGGTPKK